MTPPLRVLHLNTERGWRGGEAQTLLLARGLQARGHACRMAVPAGSPLAERAVKSGVSVVDWNPGGEFDLRAIFRLAAELREHPPDLVHYHTSHAITLGTLASYRTGRRRTVASRRVSFSLSRNPLARIKYTHRVDRIIAVSEGIRDLLEGAGIPGERIRVVPSAVDLERFRDLPPREVSRRRIGSDPGGFLIGAVGHLAGHKGHRVLIEAARRLSGECPELRYLLVGRGELEAELRSQIRSSGLEGVFRLAGFREEVAEVLPAFDLLVFPSLSGEGSPAVVKEAMACGLPVVASDISGVREVIRHGEEGLLVPPGDSEALAAAIRSLFQASERRVDLGRRGRERCREFAVDRMVERSEAVYRELLVRAFPG